MSIAKNGGLAWSMQMTDLFIPLLPRMIAANGSLPSQNRNISQSFFL
jgi:hypothetical protein